MAQAEKITFKEFQKRFYPRMLVGYFYFNSNFPTVLSDPTVAIRE